MSLNIRAMGVAFAAVLLTFASGCGGPADGSAGRGGSGGPVVTDVSRLTKTVGDPEGLFLTIRGQQVLNAELLTEVRLAGEVALPPGFAAAGPGVVTYPPGTSFEYPGQLGIPVDANRIPAGMTLEDLFVFQRLSNGLLIPAPVVDVDEAGGQLLVSLSNLGTFQVASRTTLFRFAPQEALLEQRFSAFSHQLSTLSARGAVTFSLAQVQRTSGGETTPTEGEAEPDEDGNFEIAPGVLLNPFGRISGIPTEAGAWAFTVVATDSDSTGPRTAALSLTLTVMERTSRPVPGFPGNDTQFAYTAEGDAIVLIANGGGLQLHRIPADDTEPTISSGSISAFGINPVLAVHPSGDAMVIAYEQPVGRSLDFGVTPLRQAISADEEGLVSGVQFDLTGDGAADVTVEFSVDPELGFTASQSDLFAFAAALNQALADASLAVDASASPTFEGLRIVDNGAGVVGMAPTPAQSPRILAGGSALGPIIGTITNTVNFDPNHRRVYVVELDGQLQVTGGPFRCDAEPVFDPEDPDASLTAFSRMAMRPGVGFAADPTATEPEADAAYLVAWENVSHTELSGGLRADVWAVWRRLGAGAVTLPGRLDRTDSYGSSGGTPIQVAATANGATVVWVERGGTEATGEELPAGATPGDIAAVTLGAPPAAPTGGGDLPELSAPEPEFVNDSETTTGLHPALTVSRTGEVWIVWSERDDQPVNQPGDGEVTAAQAGRGSQTSGLLLRRDLVLRAGRLEGGTVSDAFQADVIGGPASSVYSTSISVNSEGEIAVTWVEAPHFGQQRGYLRRFLEAGMALELPLWVSFPVGMQIRYDEQDRLGLISRTGGSLHVFNFNPPAVELPEPEPDPEPEE